MPVAPVLDVIAYDMAKVVNAPHPGAFSNPNEWYGTSCP